MPAISSHQNCHFLTINSWENGQKISFSHFFGQKGKLQPVWTQTVKSPEYIIFVFWFKIALIGGKWSFRICNCVEFSSVHVFLLYFKIISILQNYNSLVPKTTQSLHFVFSCLSYQNTHLGFFLIPTIVPTVKYVFWRLFCSKKVNNSFWLKMTVLVAADSWHCPEGKIHWWLLCRIKKWPLDGCKMHFFT